LFSFIIAVQGYSGGKGMQGYVKADHWVVLGDYNKKRIIGLPVFLTLSVHDECY
jgi:hypothetical protein